MVIVMSLIGKLSQIGNFEPCIWEKRYFLPLGTTLKTGVGFIAKKKITELLPFAQRNFMKPQNYVEGQKFCHLTDLTICQSTETCCFKSCFHDKKHANQQNHIEDLRYMLKSLIFNGTYH